MSSEAELRARLRKIEALFAGAGTPGERDAAAAAIERLRARLAEAARHEAPIEMQFSLPDPWSRRLFLALARRYGLRPYRYPRQRASSIVLRVPRRFLDEVLMPEFKALNEALTSYLAEVTERLIREEIHGDTSEAAESPAALPAGRTP
ncbi:MAG: hypothetical protein U1E23_13410 [Reyranellaceae bacterium]